MKTPIGSSLFSRGLPFIEGKHSFLNDGHERVGVDIPAKPLSSVRTRQHAQDFSGPPASLLASTSPQTFGAPSGHANN